MDDILVLSPTRWKPRKAVKAINEVLGSLRMEKHPDKTFILGSKPEDRDRERLRFPGLSLQPGRVNGSP